MLSSTLGAIHEYPDYVDPHYGYYQNEPAYGGYYPEYEHQQHHQYTLGRQHHGQRHSTASEQHYPTVDYQPSYHPAGHYSGGGDLNKSGSKLIINSDISSSTLGIINPSLQVVLTPLLNLAQCTRLSPF